MNEIWKNYVGTYQVSNLGHVFNSKTNRMLKSSLSQNGYPIVNLRYNNIHKSFYVHKMVAELFVDNSNPLLYTQIDHIDGNKLNNNVNNLQYVTPKENTQRAINLGLMTNRGINHNFNKLTKEQVLEIRSKYIPYKYSSLKLAKEYGIAHSNILKIIHNKYWKDLL